MKIFSLKGVEYFNINDEVVVSGKFNGAGKVVATFYPEMYSKENEKLQAEAAKFLISQPFPQVKVRVLHTDTVVIYNAEDILEGKVSKNIDTGEFLVDREIEIANLMSKLWNAMDNKNFEICKEIKMEIETVNRKYFLKKEIDKHAIF